MRSLVPALIALAGCHLGPVWRPGDEPLALWVDDQIGGADRAATVCRIWAPAGVECMPATRSEADVTVIGVADLPGVRIGVAAERLRQIKVDVPRSRLHDRETVDAIVAHEFGHLLGVIDHLDGRALMSADLSSHTVTGADIAAVWHAWREAQ